MVSVFRRKLKAHQHGGSPLKSAQTDLVCRRARGVSGNCSDDATIVMTRLWRCALNRWNIVWAKSNCYDLPTLLVAVVAVVVAVVAIVAVVVLVVVVVIVVLLVVVVDFEVVVVVLVVVVVGATALEA